MMRLINSLVVMFVVIFVLLNLVEGVNLWLVAALICLVNVSGFIDGQLRARGWSLKDLFE